MNVIELLHFLACNPHYKVDLDALVIDMPDEIKHAFSSNNCELLKNYFSNSLQPDRNTIFQL